MTLHLTTILNTPDERHAFVIGIAYGLTPWISHKYPSTLFIRHLLTTEYHYYATGHAIGTLLWLPILKALKDIITG